MTPNKPAGKKWKHRKCTFETRLIKDGGFIESQTWCKNHNERIVINPL